MKNNFFIDNNMRINPKISQNPATKNNAALKTNFSELLNRELLPDKEIKFSKHALERLHDRKIVLSSGKIDKLNEAMEKAEAKGSKESLILMDDLAFVVSIKNRTVITAVDGSSIKDNVFTNIDSAVIV